MAVPATKTLFITVSRPSVDVDWGFSLDHGAHNRLDQPLYIQHVAAASPAYEAGLYPGDIVLGIDNSPITGRPLTYTLACELVQRARLSIELQVLRERTNRVKRKTMYSTNASDSYRPASVNLGVIPSVAHMDSGVRLPDNNVKEFKHEKAREQWAITKQTYRTTPLIEPKPKVRRDWPMGSYLRHMEGPGWHAPPKGILVQDPTKLKVLNQLNQPDGQPMVHLQYNSPINLYSQENLNNSIIPGTGSPASQFSPATGPSPAPSFNAKANLTKPVTVNITQSPTYQFLQEETARRPGLSPKYSPVTGQHSPGMTQQTPYMKTLMYSLHVPQH